MNKLNKYRNLVLALIIAAAVSLFGIGAAENLCPTTKCSNAAKNQPAGKGQPPATGLPLPKLSVNVDMQGKDDEMVLTLQILVVMTILTLAPSIFGDDDQLHTHYCRVSLS